MRFLHQNLLTKPVSNSNSIIVKPIITVFILSALLLFSSCEKEEQTVTENPNSTVTPPTTSTDPPTELGDFRIGFYNVENLFDTTDDPNNEKDDEFLAAAPKEWTQDRYQKKIENIGLVLKGIDFPMLMGFSEVENEQVLIDLAQSDLVKSKDYGIVHYDSPDFRGIDVALLYKKSDFSVLSTEAIEVSLPASVSQFATTRDILLVKGTYKNEVLYVFVNHWPSRSGGVAATTQKREFAATILRESIENILTEEANANIIALGDFNDEPFNKSINEVLLVKNQKPATLDNALYNCAIPLVEAGKGSYFFDSDWQLLDQAIVSGSLLDDSGVLKVVGFNVFNDPMVMFNHPTDGLRPNRTYSGNEYFGGFSDHLAVYLEVKNL